jgi:hypothetical protein
MPFINLPASVQSLFGGLETRILKLEGARYSVPVVAADPTNVPNGFMWINSTTNLLKIKDATGATKTITWA